MGAVAKVDVPRERGCSPGVRLCLRDPDGGLRGAGGGRLLWSLLVVRGAELETGFDCTGDPAQTISFSLRGTECRVVEGLWFPLGVRGVEREVDAVRLGG